VTAASSQDQDPRRLVGLELVERVDQLLTHLQIDGVARLGPIQGESGDRSTALDLQRLIAHVTPPRDR
jgi:hypothetical protein